MRAAAATVAVVAGLGFTGASVASDADAEPGPPARWCPGEFWDPGWGDNWDWGHCHDRFTNDSGQGWGPLGPDGPPPPPPPGQGF